MKKIFKSVLVVFMLTSLCSCKNNEVIDEPVVNPIKEVTSVADFEEIGVTGMKPITNKDVDEVNYYIVNGQIAEIQFFTGDNKYVYRGSRDLGAGAITGIYSAPITALSTTIDGISFNYASYNEGLCAIWIKDMITYSLFAEGITEDGNYEFARILELLTDVDLEIEDEVELPQINEKTTKDYIVEWFNDNGFKDVDYEYENSDTVFEGYVIRLSKEGKVYPSDEIICTISAGKEKPEIVNVPDNMLNYSEEEFINACSDLGIGTSRGSTKYYSTTIKEGNIFSYDDGNFPVGTIIKYHLSKGAYAFDADEYNGLTEKEVNEYVDSLNKLNAHVSISLEKHETLNHEAGKVYKCNGIKDGIKTNVSCRLAIKPEDKRVELPNYVGTYNNPCGTGNACSVNEINYSIEYLEDGNPAGYISNQSVAPGKVEPGTEVKLSISTAMPYIYRIESGYYDKFKGNWYDQTEEALMQDTAFGKFKYVTFETITDINLPNGGIVDIQIFDETTNLWINDYEAGNYPSSTKVKIILNDIRLLIGN